MHRCKKRFLRFLFLPRFQRFLTFFILSTFFIFKKTFIENPIKKFEKHFWNHRNELGLIGLDFIMKVAGRRAALCPLRTEHNYYYVEAVPIATRLLWRHAV